MKRTYRFITAVAAMIGLAACCLEEDNLKPEPANDDPGLITIAGEISQIYQTRANDSGFADKDEIGVYIVDYNGSDAGTLRNNGNRADNVKFTFDEAAYKWTPVRDIYWKDKETHIDVYGYYPYTSVENVNEYAFEVQKDQSTEALNGKIGGYEASDFLWGKAGNAAPTDRIVRLSFAHKMAGVRVTLVKGTGFSDAEWSEASKKVLILNTKRKAMVDLSTGVVLAIGDANGTGIIPYRKGKDFRAVVVPQEIAEGTPLISVTVDGISYKFNRGIVFAPSRQHNFTITVNKRAPGDFEFTVSDESITAWENDAVSHDATTREYIVIDVETPGTLDKCIEAAGKDVAKVKNLKVTGAINARDFAIMKYLMPVLQSLNLKEVHIKAVESGNITTEYETNWYDGGRDNEIPAHALSGKKSLLHLVLPNKITRVCYGAFHQCSNLTGSLTIPEGVTCVESGAFSWLTSMTGTLSLPESLIRIEGDNVAGGGGAFNASGFVSEIHLPSKLEHIGSWAFDGCNSLYGELHFPETLTYLGENAFINCKKLSGSITIPQLITNVSAYAFCGCEGLNGTLTLHDGITSIGANAFENCRFKGELVLPKSLISIGSDAFSGCDFSGKLVLPDGLASIGFSAFLHCWRLSGILEIPDNVISIGSGTFAGCRSLEGVILPEGLETILDRTDGYGAFEDCFGINIIVCKGTIPPYIQSGAFDGVSKDNFTVEVPESAVIQYQAAPGWSDFKRISAYRNLSISPNVATALNTKVTRNLVLNADDEWEVESAPAWVILSQKEGKGKTELKLEFLQMPHGSNREGKIVFKLKDKDYRATCYLTQYDYTYAEDEIITLHKAAKGNGINLVFLGDGFNAKDISEGLLMKNIQEAVGHFFSIEPYKTYKEYFNVYTGIAVSPESGIGGVNTIIYNKFNTSAKGGVTLGGRNGESDYNEIFKYACKSPTVNEGNLNKTLIIIVPNTSEYGGICYMYDGGEAIAYCPVSDYGYPLDFRGVIQHEAGGHGFGKLGDEYIYHNAFIDACSCTCCGHVDEFNRAKAKGWYENLSLTGKMDEVPWSHLIFDEKYGKIVDIYEGGFMHSRGVYRSEYNSCMNNEIPYYSTISREAIVRRIMEYAGEEYSFEKFAANDNIENLPETATAATKASPFSFSVSGGTHQHEPVFMGKRPTLK